MTIKQAHSSLAFTSRLAVAALIAVVCTTIQNVQGHAKWVCPTPRVDSSSLKSGPCGGVGSPTDAGLSKMTIAPGPFTVYFQETITHSGAPFRISLSKPGVDDFESCVLLDHIPHNDARGNAVYGITINIPDFDCQNCALQVIQFMTDKLSTPTCTFDPATQSGGACFSNYFSCANVQITGTGAFNPSQCTPPSDFAQSYVYARGEKGDWTNSGYLATKGPDSVRIPVKGACTSQVDPNSFLPNGTFIDSGNPLAGRGSIITENMGILIGAIVGVVAFIALIAFVVVKVRSRRSGVSIRKASGAHDGFNKFGDDDEESSPPIKPSKPVEMSLTAAVAPTTTEGSPSLAEAKAADAAPPATTTGQ